MKTTLLKLVLPCILLGACNRNPQDDGSLPQDLFPQPKTVEANPEGGYKVNQITGDSILPIINSLGDTIKTGVPIPVMGKLIHQDSIASPIEYKVNINPEVAIANTNNFIIPENLTVIAVDKSKLKSVNVGEGNKDFILVTLEGDTLPTGVPIPTQGKLVKAKTPKTTIALPPVFKDEAIYNIQYLDEDQGLPTSHIFKSLIDKKGNLWFATNGKGITRYNGKTFTTYRSSEGFKSDMVLDLIEDKKGNIWFSTLGGGAYRFDGEYFAHFTPEEGLISNFVTKIIEDNKGNIWFSQLSESISCFQPNPDSTHSGTFTHYSPAEGLSSSTISRMFEDSRGNIWLSDGKGVCIYQPASSNSATATFTFITKADGLLGDIVTAIYEDSKGNIWLGTSSGLCLYQNPYGDSDSATITHFTTNDGLSGNFVNSITEDKFGNLWVGTTDTGVNLLTPKTSEEGKEKSGLEGYSTITHYTEKEGLSQNQTSSILADESGNIWVSSNYGVSIINRASFYHYPLINNNKGVISIKEDKSGNLWFTTNGDGFTKLGKTSAAESDSFINYKIIDESLSTNILWSIHEDKRGHLWLGHIVGPLFRYNGETCVEYSAAQGLCGRGILSILEDRRGNLWFGAIADGGLTLYEPASDGLNNERFTHFTEKEGLSNTRVRVMMEDSKGNIWCGHSAGVSIFQPSVADPKQGTLTHLSESEGLGNNDVMTIIEDKRGNIWIGTHGNGVSKYDGKTFTYFTVAEGLVNNYVRTIIEDNNDIWVSTEKGLSLISDLKQGFEANEKDGNKTYANQYHIINYGKQDGLMGLMFYQNSAFKDSKNQAWWGSGKSLTRLNLNEFQPSQNPPVLHLKHIDINGLVLDYRNFPSHLKDEINFSGVENLENYPYNLDLRYNQNHLTFHFVGIDWAAPHKIHYSHRMLGLNKNWSTPSQEPKADYRNLSSGTYTFQVRAIGESREWSEPFEYTYTIQAPWWHTWWAYLVYILLFLWALRAFSKWRERNLRAAKEKLEFTVKERTEELVQKNIIVEKEKQRSDELLLNILPEEIAKELKERGESEAKLFDDTTVLFTDFKEFTGISEKLTPKELVADLNHAFSTFDAITQKYGIEKIKTIGDAYMAAGGLPTPNATHAKDVVMAALEIRDFIERGKEEKIKNNQPFFEIRIGVNTGPVVAGIVGVKKFQYDIWGDTVNTAARMETNGEAGKINISQSTYELLKDDPRFEFEHRGKIKAKGKGEVDMYFVSVNS